MPTYIRDAQTPFTPKRRDTLHSILDVEFPDGLMLYVFPGSLSPNDIWVKYKRRDSRIRTPRHIHWAVDLLIKKFLNRELTSQLLQVFIENWNGLQGLAARGPESIIARLSIARSEEHNQRFQPLNSLGFFRLDFLMHLMELLMLQEKTNNPNAYMFGNVLDGLLNSRDPLQDYFCRRSNKTLIQCNS